MAKTGEMKLRPLHISRVGTDKPGVTYRAELIIIKEDNIPVPDGFIPAEQIIEEIHLPNDRVREFKKKDKTIDYDLIEIYCWVQLIGTIKNRIYKHYLQGKL